MPRTRYSKIELFAILCLSIAATFASACTQPSPPRPALNSIRTLAGANLEANSRRLGDPYGIAVATDGTVYFSDGETGLIWRLNQDETLAIIAENLNTPSGLALAPDGTLVVADTGSHTIKRIDVRSGRIATIAGAENHAGFADGNGVEALFDGPIGVAVDQKGTIFVADTYNDRIRGIDAEGRVRTLAGGSEPAFADAADGAEARFNTPCGIVVDLDGSLVVADTGNHRLRRIRLDGAVTTIAGTDNSHSVDGYLLSASFDEPVSVAIDEEGSMYVADAGGSTVRVCDFNLWPQVTTLAGADGAGLLDGPLNRARLNRPSAVAFSPDRTLLVVDSGNKLVRVVVRENARRGIELREENLAALRRTSSDFRDQSPPRWPYNPPDRPREIAATFGEIRGEIGEGEEAWFHNGLDIPGAYGETVRVMRSERVLRPLAVEGVGGERERIRFPTLGYIHLRVGRDKDNGAFPDQRFKLQTDADGNVMGVRVRRGALFEAGDAIGTLNNQNHVHLIAGQTGWEHNALAALELPRVKDTLPPVIEKNGVRLFDRAGRELVAPSSNGGDKRGQEAERPIAVQGDVTIVVRTYDQMDGNSARRRLGLYQLGYQILNADGTPAAGFAEPLTTISFESLPDDHGAIRFAYADGSKSGATGETIFAYIVTNIVRDRAASEDYWHSSKLPRGDYVLRVFAADYFGNRTTRDVAVRVVSTEMQ